MKKQWAIGVILGIVSLCGFWIYRSIVEKNFRAEIIKSLTEIHAQIGSVLAKDIVDDFKRKAAIINAGPYEVAGILRDGDKEILARAQDVTRLRDRFLGVEKQVKERYGGELPTWLKEDRIWRSLDKTFQG